MFPLAISREFCDKIMATKQNKNIKIKQNLYSRRETPLRGGESKVYGSYT